MLEVCEDVVDTREDVREEGGAEERDEVLLVEEEVTCVVRVVRDLHDCVDGLIVVRDLDSLELMSVLEVLRVVGRWEVVSGCVVDETATIDTLFVLDGKVIVIELSPAANIDCGSGVNVARADATDSMLASADDKTSNWLENASSNAGNESLGA